MIENNPIYIKLASIDDRMIYRQFCKVNAPIYLKGDKINAKLVIEKLENDQPIKFKGLTVSLVAKVFKEKHIVEDFILTTKKFKEDSEIVGNGIIDKPNTEYQFIFDGLNFNCPSYFGFKYKIMYYVEIIIIQQQRWNQNISLYEPIYLLDPVPDQFPKQPVSKSIEHENISLNVYFDQGIIPLNGTIHGQMAFGDTTKSNILQVTLDAIFSETYDGKTEETKIVEYEVMDGCPRSGTTVPFMIQLQQYKLSYLQDTSKSKLTTQFFIEIKVSCKNNILITSRQPFQLFLPKL